MDIGQPPAQLRHLATTYDYRSLDRAIENNPRSKPSNGDGVLTNHKTGRVIFFENKQKGEEISQGQAITLTDLLGLNEDKVLVLVVEHSGAKTEIGAFEFDPVRFRIWPEEQWFNTTIQDFRDRIDKWAKEHKIVLDKNREL